MNSETLGSHLLSGDEGLMCRNRGIKGINKKKDTSPLNKVIVVSLQRLRIARKKVYL